MHVLHHTCVRLIRRAILSLFRDDRGNVLILSAAFMIPMLALVGSSIDVGRAYVARSRMQQACDAASLAGRWAFSQGQTTTSATNEALKFFNFNFKQGAFGTESFTPAVNVTGSTTKVVQVTAATTLRLSVMGIFGFQPIRVAASCTAEQNFVNTDIVLVLDTTGSMAQTMPGDTQTKISALRSAVLALYDQLAPIQTQLAAAGMRLRFSVVPYSSTINVGKLIYNVKPEYIRNPAPYYQANTCYSGRSSYTCYQQVSVNHSTSGPNWFTNSWGGCIEERQTTSAITSTSTTIPSAAYDLDIDKIPTPDVNTQWPPYDTSAETAKSFVACPSEAKRLQTWTRADLSTYLNGLSPNGGTYHDIGMIWGARMISNAGIFADSPDTYAGMPTNKFVIFMTDDMLDTNLDSYSAYGVERYDQRVTGGDLTSQDARHQQRFNLMCKAIKNRSVSIWVVVFNSSMSSDIVNCASNAGQASKATNAADFINKFTEIGKNIGAMRLTQ